METNEDEKVFRCNVQESPSWGNNLVMDGKNLYYWGAYFYYEYKNRIKCYSIPLKNGKMEQIGKGKIRNFTYNNKYYFYVDKKYRLHRQNRKTKKDKIISDIKVSEVKCTNAGLYVKKYDSWFDNGGFEWANMDYSRTLYFMDFDGENVKRIAKGKRGHIDY